MGRKLLKKSKSLRFFLFIILVFLFFIYGFIYFDNKIKPAVFNIAEMRVKEIATIAVNEAIFTEFAEKIQYDDLVRTKIDDEGNIVALQANTVLINTISSNMTLLIQNNIHNITSSQIKIPIGSILGSQILSQYGPMITLNVIPIGMTKVNFNTEFENAGINQTRHKIFLDVETYAKVIVPFNTNTINVHMTVPIAETIIVGEVPQSYVFIPENELTNMLPSM